MATKNIATLEKKLQKVTEAGIKTSIEKKLAEARERYNITHNIDKVSAILDDLERLFDELETQLVRTKQSKWLTLKVPIITKVVCFCHMLKYFRKHLRK